MTAYRPKTGDVFLADLEPVICIPLTTNLSRRGLQGTCFIKKGDGGLPQDSIALCFQMRAIDKSRLTKRYVALNPATLNALAVLSAMGMGI